MTENDSEPPEIEFKDFFFKQMRKLRVFKSPTDLMTERVSLLAVSNQYGVIYVAGDNTALKAIKVATIEKVHIEVDGSLQVEEENFPSYSIDVGHPFSHIALSCDDLVLAVCFERSGSCMLGFLDVRAFFNEKSPKKLFCEVVLSSEKDVKVRDVAWNPNISETIAVLLTNGHILMVELKGSQAKIPASMPGPMTAVSWSPKGKQIVAGSRDGSLTQLTPRLQEKKCIPAPDILTGPCEVTDVVWITTRQFGVVFSAHEDGEISGLIVITTPKDGPTTLINFEDLYYGMSEDREACFYMNHIPELKMILSIYANSYEVAAVGQSDEGSWMKWNLPDSARAVLPTTHNYDETFPLGLGVSFATSQSIKQDDQTYSPAPILLLLSTDGVLCPFYMINKNPKAPNNVTKPAAELNLGEERVVPISSTPGDTASNSQSASGDQPVSSAISVLPALSSSSATPARSDVSDERVPQTIGFSKEYHAALKSVQPSLGSQPLASLTASASSKPEQPSDATTIPAISSSASGAKPVSSAISVLSALSSSSAIPTRSDVSDERVPQTIGFSKENHLALKSAQPSLGSQPVASLTASASSKPEQPSDATTIPAISSSGPQVPCSSKVGPVPFTPLSASSQIPERDTAGLVTKSIQQEHGPRSVSTGDVTPGNNLLNRENVGQFSAGCLPEGKNNPGSKMASQETTPGSKPINTLAKLQPEEKPLNQSSLSRKEKLDAFFQKYIHNEIGAFKEEMKELQNRLNEAKKLDSILKDMNRAPIMKQVTSHTRFICELKTAIEELRDDVEGVKSDVVEAYELLDDARICDKRSMDPRYLHLLKGRGLDLSSERKMKDIRSSYLKLDSTLREVNMALDERWEKENKQGRVLQTPSLHFIYQAMNKNKAITRNQTIQLEAISNHLKNQSLCHRRWDRPPVGSQGDSDDVLSLSESLRSQKLHSTTSRLTSRTVPARKQSQIRNMLSKRQSVPVRKISFISDLRTRSDSLNEALSAYDESGTLTGDGLEKEGKKYLGEDYIEKKEILGKEKMLTFRMERSVGDKADMIAQTKPKDTKGKKQLLFPASPAETSPSLSMIDKKPLQQQKTAPVLNPSPLSLSGIENPVQPQTSTPVATFAKDTAGGFSAKPLSGLSPRDAARYAAIQRAEGSHIKVDSGAAIPAKTMVEHKATDSKIVTSATKDNTGEQHAHAIAKAALEDAENKIKNVTQAPPSNTGTTFTTRSSSSFTQSTGPPVMVVLPGGKLGLNMSAGVQPIPATSTSSVFSIPLAEPTLSQQPGRKFGVKLPPDNPVTSATQSTLVASPNKFAVGQNLLLFTTQQSLSDHHPNIPGVPDKPFSSQAQRSGPGAAEINASKTSESVPAATPSTSSNVPTVLDKGKGNIKPTLFDKTQSVEEENTDVAVRGEPEGESKQPATIKPISQRQAAVGKSEKDTDQPSGISRGTANQSLPNSPSSPDATKPPSQTLSSGLNLFPQTSSPFVFNAGSSSFNFSTLGQTQVPTLADTVLKSTPSTISLPTFVPSSSTLTTSNAFRAQTGSTTASTTSDVISTTSSSVSSQQAHRLEAVGSLQANLQLPFGGFQSNPIPLSTLKSPHASAASPQNLPSLSSTTTTPVFGTTDQKSDKNPGFVSAVTTSTLGQPSLHSISGETLVASGPNLKVSTETRPTLLGLTTTATLSSVFQSSPLASSATEDSFVKASSSNSSVPVQFGATSSGSPVTSHQTTTATTTAQGITFSSQAFPATSPNTGFGFGEVNKPTETQPSSGFVGGFSGLGGKPQEPNRNPFEARPSSQISEPNLFGSAPNSNVFQSSTSAPTFASGQPGSGGISGNTEIASGSGVASMGFGGASLSGTTPSFGGAPSFGVAPSFGSPPVFGGSPSFGNPPAFVGAPAFGSGFTSPGKSPERVFGSGTETSAMFGSSTAPTFGSLSAQSGMPSFGGLASEQTAPGLGGSSGFNPSMSGSSFSSYR